MIQAGTVYATGDLIPMGASLRTGSDELMAAPLWGFNPSEVGVVLSERRRRNILQHDPEPIGDPEYK